MKTIAIQPAHIHCTGCVHLGDYDGKTECMNCIWWEGGTPEDAPCYERVQWSVKNIIVAIVRQLRLP
jgi:hypothetical protein